MLTSEIGKRSASAAFPIDYELLFRSVPSLCLVLTPDLRIVSASDQYVRATMLDLEWAVGRHIFDAFPDRPDDPEATGVRNLRDSLLSVLATKQPDTMAVQRYPIRAANGSFEDRFWSPVNFPILGSDGEVSLIIHRVEDVTELMELRQLHPEDKVERSSLLFADVLARAREVQESNRRLREAGERHDQIQRRTEVVLQSIVDTAIDGIITIDERGRVMTFNRAAERIFGYAADEVVGRNVSVLMPAPYHDEHDGYIEAYLRTGVARIIGIGREVSGRRKDGTTFPMELAVSSFEQDGRPHFTGLVRDVTARKHMEEQLRQAQKMEAVGQLAAGVAHDFNNVLTVISGYGELMNMTLPEDDPCRPMVDEVRQAAERAITLTSQLLAFSRQQVMTMSVFELNPLLVATEKMLARLIGEDIRVVSRLAPDLRPVRANRAQIDQVVMNLAVNARDAMPEGGTITIETRNIDIGGGGGPAHPVVPPGSYALLTVTDTGTGMSPEIVSRVFEPFFTTKECDKGTGLGLSVVHGIVTQCGGHVDVYSEEGVGTSFKVYLPAAEAEVATSVEAAPAPAAGGSEAVLLVEDDASVRAFAALALKTMGYDVLEAGTGADALDLVQAREGKLDLIITDVVMPGMSGRKLAEAVRQQYPAIKVLFMSGYTDDAIVRHGVQQSELHFLQKPFTHASLLARIRETLDS